MFLHLCRVVLETLLETIVVMRTRFPSLTPLKVHFSMNTKHNPTEHTETWRKEERKEIHGKEERERTIRGEIRWKKLSLQQFTISASIINYICESHYLITIQMVSDGRLSNKTFDSLIKELNYLFHRTLIGILFEHTGLLIERCRTFPSSEVSSAGLNDSALILLPPLSLSSFQNGDSL